MIKAATIIFRSYFAGRWIGYFLGDENFETGATVSSVRTATQRSGLGLASTKISGGYFYSLKRSMVKGLCVRAGRITSTGEAFKEAVLQYAEGLLCLLFYS